jgi:hypothetical protein
VADLVRNVGGERVNVESLMGPGVDPHLYKASAGDVRRLEGADVIFYNGLHLEAGMAVVLERMGEQRNTVAVTRYRSSQLMAPPEFAGNYDPHVWFDVSMWMQAVETVRDVLIEIDPQGADIYQQNTENYLAELEALHGYIQEQAGRIPEEMRVLITAHDAFNYFGRAYGFEVRGLQGISTASEVGAADVQDWQILSPNERSQLYLLNLLFHSAILKPFKPPCDRAALKLRSAANYFQTRWDRAVHRKKTILAWCAITLIRSWPDWGIGKAGEHSWKKQSKSPT